MDFTQREREVIRELLVQQGIRSYDIFLNALEGSLPQGTYPNEVRAMSGSIVTASKIYSFWLDWYDGRYTLGQEEGFWEEEMLSELSVPDRAAALEMRRALQEQEMTSSE